MNPADKYILYPSADEHIAAIYLYKYWTPGELHFDLWFPTAWIMPTHIGFVIQCMHKNDIATFYGHLWYCWSFLCNSFCGTWMACQPSHSIALTAIFWDSNRLGIAAPLETILYLSQTSKKLPNRCIAEFAISFLRIYNRFLMVDFQILEDRNIFFIFMGLYYLALLGHIFNARICHAFFWASYPNMPTGSLHRLFAHCVGYHL